MRYIESMNWLDVAIVVFLIAAVIRGVQVGFIRQISSTFGFFLGLFLGALAEGELITLVSSPYSKALLALLIVLGCGCIGMAAGEYGGHVLKYKLRNQRIIDKIDKVLGAIIGIVTLVVAVWIGAAIFRSMPPSLLQRQLRNSHLVALINRAFPSAPTVIAKLGHLMDPNSFPQVFIGLEPRLKTDQPLPDLGDFAPVVANVKPSVVMIEGEGCGGIIEGSGFVAESSLVATNAHVVAGVTHPTVLDSRGQHRTTVIAYDPELDLAILRVDNLAGKPLALSGGTVKNNTEAVVLGYPGGGGFDAAPALVLESFTATGRNIYNQGKTERNIYSIKADVRQGNSGGPLIDKNGAVIGLVFAESTNYDNVGYALVMDAVIQELVGARNNTKAVSTGSCAQ